MDKIQKKPYTPKLLRCQRQDAKNLGQVTDLSIFTPSSKMFSSEGLYSHEIFGLPGTSARSKNFGYIDLKVNVISPLLFSDLMKIGTYKKVAYGLSHAIFEEGDFTLCDKDKGDTGYLFFIKHIKKLIPKATGSVSRGVLIKQLDKYRDTGVSINIMYVVPAIYREYTVSEEGRGVDNEINDFYRSILRTTNNIPDNVSVTDKVYDKPVLKIQEACTNLAEFIESILFDTTGKGFINSKITKRKVFNGTSNVLTATASASISSLSKDNTPHIDEVTVGLAQFLKGILPIAIHGVISLPFMSKIFPEHIESVNGIDVNTFESVVCNTKQSLFFRKWTNYDGVEKLIDNYLSPAMQIRPVEIDGITIALIYDNPNDNNIFVITDINTVDESIDQSFIRPITPMDIFTLAVFNKQEDIVMTSTRYPVDNPGSMVLSRTNVLITIKDKKDRVVDMGDGKKVYFDAYPTLSESSFSSISVPAPYIKPMGADFDGDKVTSIFYYTKDAREQAHEILDSVKYYLNVRGELKTSSSNTISDLTFRHLTS